MSADEYWYGPPSLVLAYAEAHKLKMRYDNQLAWLQGAYFHHAVMVALSNGFSKKGSKKEKYPSEPFDLGMETEVEKEIKAQQDREKLIKRLNAWKAAWDAHKKSGEKQ